MDAFPDRLRREYETRKTANVRYSLRAFASFLATDHSTLSQILRAKRRISTAQLREWGKKLGVTREEIAVYIATEHVPSGLTRERQEQLRHWAAEGLAIVTDPCHWRIIELTHNREFRGDSRWIAQRVGVSVDHVNVAVTRLLRLRLLQIGPNGRWREPLDQGRQTEAGFRKLALIRIRELAANDGVQLLRSKAS